MTRVAIAAAPNPVRTAATRDCIVRIRHLTKAFPVRRPWLAALRNPRGSQSATVVHDVTCDVRQGEFFGLLGPNGAGKTTLFKMLSTLISPDSGTAHVGEYDVTHEAHRVRRVLTPVIADERSLNWRLSARGNLQFYGALYGLEGAELRCRVEQLLDAVELSHTGTKMVGQFSSGMKQRLLLARALLARPKVLLLDEPTRSLDPVSARRFRTFLREEITGRQGCTVLLATHNAEEAMELCNRVAILNKGNLVALGSPEELSLQVRGERYRIWTSQPGHYAFALLAARDLIRGMVVNEPDATGLTPVDVEITGGIDQAAPLNAALVGEGVPVARLERVQISLAELIERIVQKRESSEAHA